MDTREKIPFNKPHLSGRELEYIEQAVRNGRLSGDGPFGRRCQSFFEHRWGFPKCLLTSSGSDALEMTALLLDLQPGDEVIMPAFTFVSTANAFVLRGARIVFSDSMAQNPNMDVAGLESLITPRTRAIVPVHYGGIACDMDPLMELARRHRLSVVEDAAQGIAAAYRGRPLGSIGNLASFSFHETKNVIAGEGGMLAVNDPCFFARAEIIWEKGTNRTAFFRGEIDKYHWVDVGSSYLPSELNAAYLWAQLENLEGIQERRMAQWQQYADRLFDWADHSGVQRPFIPDYADHNGHLFYLVFDSEKERDRHIARLRRQNISAVFHYQCLHDSPFYRHRHDGRPLPQAERYAAGLVRLPLYHDLTDEQVDRICDAVIA